MRRAAGLLLVAAIAGCGAAAPTPVVSIAAPSSSSVRSGPVPSASDSLNPDTGSPSTAAAWTPAAAMRSPRFDASATVLSDGRVLVACGAFADAAGRGGVVPATELYDPAMDTWSAADPLHAARGICAAELLPSGKVLVTGGVARSADGLATAELFDPATGHWMAARPMNIF